MLAQLEKTLNIALVWLVPSVRLVGENVNFGDLTNHLENLRSILATLLCRHGAHDDLFPNEIKHTKGFLIRSHPHKYFFGNVGDIVVVAYLRSESVTENLIQHPIDKLHAMSGPKLNVAISGVIHEGHLAIKRDLTSVKFWVIKILLTKPKNASKPLIKDREGLPLKELMESLGFTPNIEIGINWATTSSFQSQFTAIMVVIPLAWQISMASLTAVMLSDLKLS
jgi:hypothetical protein